MAADRIHPIIFLAGASGVGKTALVERLANNPQYTEYGLFHFDSIGVPPIDEMVRDFGSGEAWQRAMTFEWVERLVEEETSVRPIILEGQVNLQYITDAFAAMNFTNYRIILVDCCETVMARRLAHLRQQPDLVTSAMRNWLNFLRSQAREMKVPSLDTSDLTPDEMEAEFEVLLDREYLKGQSA